ncbi:aspartic protease 7 [Aphelenchoides avenae]|nr:aspartic protease 7 [Aphelenchus avenae]
MIVGRVLLSVALGFILASGTPLHGPAKSMSLPLHRPYSVYESDDAQEPLPLSVNGIESLVYTVDVQLGSQIFNLTLDTNAEASVLFAKGFVASNRSCSKGDAERRLFDPSLSTSFKVTTGSVGGWFLYEYPYVGLECHQSVGAGQLLQGVWGQDAYNFGTFSVPEVPFILSNNTYYPLNPRWASDGILPLGMMYGEALKKVLGAVGGGQEVSLYLNNAKTSDNHPVPGGRITFGGKNTQDCGDKWVTLKSDDTDWFLSLNSVTIGAKSITSGDYAGLSTSTPFLEVPSWEFRPVVKALGGTFNNELDLYTVDCSKIDSLPSVKISLGSGFALIYDVKAQDYVAKINGKSGVRCALLIVQGDTGIWTVGTQFLPRRCVHLDYAKGQVGFAYPKN